MKYLLLALCLGCCPSRVDPVSFRIDDGPQVWAAVSPLVLPSAREVVWYDLEGMPHVTSYVVDVVIMGGS